MFIKMVDKDKIGFLLFKICFGVNNSARDRHGIIVKFDLS